MHEHTEWTERLSAYIDGDLAPETARELERHLAGCDECSRTVADLRALVTAAQALEDSPPPRDLWAGIAAGIGTNASLAGADVLPLHSRAPQRHRRGYSFSLPQLAAAAMLLVAFSAGGAWYFAHRAGAPEPVSGTVVHVAATPSQAGRLATDVPAAEPPSLSAEDVAELERTLATMRAQMDPATADVIERSLESIDDAIVTAREALEADPGNPHLSRQLDNTMRKKLEILRRAHRVQRAGT
jgi:hypothetical protein